MAKKATSTPNRRAEAQSALDWKWRIEVRSGSDRKGDGSHAREDPASRLAGNPPGPESLYSPMAFDRSERQPTSAHADAGGRGRSPYASWRALWAALKGRCPNCGQGRLFERTLTIRIRSTCTVCGVRFERDQGGFLGPSAMAYVVAVVFEVMLFVVLYRRFGLFPGIEWILIAVGVAAILISWKPLKGVWVWLLWVSGLVWTDRLGSS